MDDQPPSYEEALGLIVDEGRTPKKRSSHIQPPGINDKATNKPQGHRSHRSSPDEPPPPYSETDLPNETPSARPLVPPSAPPSEPLSVPPSAPPSVPPSVPPYSVCGFASNVSPSAPPYSQDNSSLTPSDRHRDTPLPAGAIGGSNTDSDVPEFDSGKKQYEKDDDSKDGAIGYSKPDILKYDLNLPGPLYIDEAEIILTQDSSPCKEIRWRGPENASDFLDLIYEAEFKATSKPIPGRPDPVFYDRWHFFDVEKWYELLQTGQPSIRIFHTPSMLIIGKIKWKLEDLFNCECGGVDIRVRAVDELNRLSSCKKGPWSEVIAVRYGDSSEDDLFRKKKGKQ